MRNDYDTTAEPLGYLVDRVGGDVLLQMVERAFHQKKIHATGVSRGKRVRIGNPSLYEFSLGRAKTDYYAVIRAERRVDLSIEAPSEYTRSTGEPGFDEVELSRADADRMLAEFAGRSDVHEWINIFYGSAAGLSEDTVASPDSAAPVAKRRRGPVQGTIRRYDDSDRDLFSEMTLLMGRDRLSRMAAALQLAEAGKVVGRGNCHSRAKRLAKLYREEIPFR